MLLESTRIHSDLIELACYWSPRFVTPNINSETWHLLYRTSNPSIITLIYNWILPYSDFLAIISSKKDSGVGPDGIPYSAYKITGDIGGEVLYNCYFHVMSGAFPSKEFNHAFLWCLSKAALTDRSDVDSRFAKETRALSGSNADHKIIGTAFISPAKGVAQSICHNAQGGLLRGRKIQDCLLTSESAAIQASMTRHTGVDWFLPTLPMRTLVLLFRG